MNVEFDHLIDGQDVRVTAEISTGGARVLSVWTLDDLGDIDELMEATDLLDHWLDELEDIAMEMHDGSARDTG